MTLSLRSSMQVTLTGLDSRELTKTVGNNFCGILGCLGGLVTPKACPGMVLGDLGAPFGVRRAIFNEFLRRLARRWAQDGRSWGQVGSKLRPRWAKIAPSWRYWAQLGRFWEHVGSILGVFWYMGWTAENLQKPEENMCLGILGCLEWGRNSTIWYGRNSGGSCAFGVLRAIL